ncbi:MAG: SDR family oxidoreductase [Actinomycetota bacterium]
MADPTSSTDRPVVLLTGAAGGIGAAVARAVARDGRTVLLADVDRDGLDRTADQLRPGRVETVELDLLDPPAIRAAVDDAESRIGPIEAVVHAAGVLYADPITELEPKRFEHMMGVHVIGLLHLIQAVSPAMIERSRGSILTIASNAARIPRLQIGAYGATKAAATMLTRSAGLELAGHGIRCNVVQPGSTRTPMLDASLGAGQGHEDVIAGDATAFRSGIPLGRVAEPDDIAATVRFLLGDGARHITMQEIVVDGGATL